MMQLTEHLADGLELAKWREFEKRFKTFSIIYYRTVARASNAIAAYDVAGRNQIAIPWEKTAEQKLIDCKVFYLKTKDLMRQVEDRSLGIRLTPSKDIDIVQPQESGELHGWFIPVLIVVGIVALAGAIAATIKKTKDLEDCERAFKAVTDFSDKRFCTDPASALCLDWKTTKAREQYRSNETIIDRLSREITQTGSKISSGLAIGLAIAIPLILYSWLGRRRPAR